MDAKELFKQAVQQATIEVNKVRPEDFSRPTPDTEWTVKDLLQHTLGELSWTRDIVAGKTMAEVGDIHEGDLVGDNPSEAWKQAAEAALTAVDQADLRAIAHLSYGDVSIESYLQEAASDQLVHGWDLAAALGDHLQFDPSVAEEVYRLTLPKLDTMKQSGLFAEPLNVADDVDTQTKLLALFGRDASWQPVAK